MKTETQRKTPPKEKKDLGNGKRHQILPYHLPLSSILTSKRVRQWSILVFRSETELRQKVDDLV